LNPALLLLGSIPQPTFQPRASHEVADKHEDVATASLLENFIDEAEKRCWFLFEASRQAERSGH
jgi:starvation-inducible DNA-binding protein